MVNFFLQACFLDIKFCECNLLELTFSSLHFWQQLNKELRELKGRVRSANEERDLLLNERQELFKRRAKLELAVKDLQEEVNGDMDAKVRY